MPSGNATITYTGDEPSITFSGETFVKGEPTHSADQGIIGGAKDRDDFKVVDHRADEAPAPVTTSEAASPEPVAEPVAPSTEPVAPMPALKPPAAKAKKLAGAKKH